MWCPILIKFILFLRCLLPSRPSYTQSVIDLAANQPSLRIISRRRRGIPIYCGCSASLCHSTKAFLRYSRFFCPSGLFTSPKAISSHYSVPFISANSRSLFSVPFTSHRGDHQAKPLICTVHIHSSSWPLFLKAPPRAKPLLLLK